MSSSANQHGGVDPEGEEATVSRDTVQHMILQAHAAYKAAYDLKQATASGTVRLKGMRVVDSIFDAYTEVAMPAEKIKYLNTDTGGIMFVEEKRAESSSGRPKSSDRCSDIGGSELFGAKMIPYPTTRTGVTRMLLNVETNLMMNHPNVLPVHEILLTKDFVCFVGEAMEMSVAELMETHYLNEYAVACILRQVLSALSALHAHGICHKRLRMDIILINTQTFTVKVAGYTFATLFPPPNTSMHPMDGIDADGNTVASSALPFDTARAFREVDFAPKAGTPSSVRGDLFYVGAAAYWLLTHGHLPYGRRSAGGSGDAAMGLATDDNEAAAVEGDAEGEALPSLDTIVAALGDGTLCSGDEWSLITDDAVEFVKALLTTCLPTNAAPIDATAALGLPFMSLPTDEIPKQIRERTNVDAAWATSFYAATEGVLFPSVGPAEPGWCDGPVYTMKTPQPAEEETGGNANGTERNSVALDDLLSTPPPAERGDGRSPPSGANLGAGDAASPPGALECDTEHPLKLPAEEAPKTPESKSQAENGEGEGEEACRGTGNTSPEPFHTQPVSGDGSPTTSATRFTSDPSASPVFCSPSVWKSGASGSPSPVVDGMMPTLFKPYRTTPVQVPAKSVENAHSAVPAPEGTKKRLTALPTVLKVPTKHLCSFCRKFDSVCSNCLFKWRDEQRRRLHALSLQLYQFSKQQQVAMLNVSAAIGDAEFTRALGVHLGSTTLNTMPLVMDLTELAVEGKFTPTEAMKEKSNEHQLDRTRPLYPLHIACGYGRKDAIVGLLEAGALFRRDGSRITPLEYAPHPIPEEWERPLSKQANYTLHQELNAAKALRSEGKLDEAEAAYRDILVDHPKNEHALCGLAKMKFDAKEFVECMRRCDDIIANPHSVEWLEYEDKVIKSVRKDAEHAWHSHVHDVERSRVFRSCGCMNSDGVVIAIRRLSWPVVKAVLGYCDAYTLYQVYLGAKAPLIRDLCAHNAATLCDNTSAMILSSNNRRYTALYEAVMQDEPPAQLIQHPPSARGMLIVALGDFNTFLLRTVATGVKPPKQHRKRTQTFFGKQKEREEYLPPEPVQLSKLLRVNRASHDEAWTLHDAGEWEEDVPF